MGGSPSTHSRGHAQVRDVSDADLDRFPVESVLWADAVEFCDKLAESVGQPIRLPTEAEWEYACRAGTTTAFCFGDDPAVLHEYAVFFSPAGLPSGRRPDVVGRRKPNAWGLHDVHGNVCEWCQDGYREYPRSEAVDPLAPSEGDVRVVRGGTYHFIWEFCRSACRVTRDVAGSSDTGLRICFHPR
jgi:formylglycine-generating enzyme required for sulfatase activity